MLADTKPKPGSRRPAPKKSKAPSAIITMEDLDEAEGVNGRPDLPEAQRELGLRLLLHPERNSSLRWKEFAATHPTDEQLRQRLIDLWRFAEKRDQPECCANSLTGTAMVWFGQQNTVGTPSLSGDELLDAVRRVLGMPLIECGNCGADIAAASGSRKKKATADDADSTDKKNSKSSSSAPSAKSTKSAAGLPATPSFDELKKKGKSNAKPEAKISAADLLAGIEVLREETIHIAMIRASKQNPRESFDESLIADMAKNIVTICQLSPITVREVTGKAKRKDLQDLMTASKPVPKAILDAKAVRLN